MKCPLPLETRWYNFHHPTPTLNFTIHFVTVRETDRQTTVLCQQPIILHAEVHSAKNGLRAQKAANESYENEILCQMKRSGIISCAHRRMGSLFPQVLNIFGDCNSLMLHKQAI